MGWGRAACAAAPWLAVVLTLATSCKRKQAAPSPPLPPPAPRVTTRASRPPLPRGFLRGQLHAHTSASADSETAPVDVQRWYAARGYDFVVFTDHNAITDTPDTETLTFAGAELTRNPRDCTPPAPPGEHCALHMNALFVGPDAGAIVYATTDAATRVDIYADELRVARALGGIAMLNHPNMASGADADIVLELSKRGLTLLEVGNQSWDADNAGDATRPSTEAIWDSALSRGARLFATVTDDAHSYDDAEAARARGERPFTGDLGFVVVRADKRADAIRAAIARGDFYGSTGLVLDTLEADATHLKVATRAGVAVDFDVIGRGGRVVRREHAARLELSLAPSPGDYVRVRARAADGATALLQPAFDVTLAR